jgi:hypothetical protein
MEIVGYKESRRRRLNSARKFDLKPYYAYIQNLPTVGKVVRDERDG